MQFDRFKLQLEVNDRKGYPVEVFEDAVGCACIEFKRNRRSEFKEFLEFLKRKIDDKPDDGELQKRGVSPEEMDRIDRYIEVFEKIYKNYFGIVEEGDETDSPRSSSIVLRSQKRRENTQLYSPTAKRASLPRACSSAAKCYFFAN